MSPAPFGNDPAKIEGYRAFWRREEVDRPLIGYTLRGWFPLQEYAASRSWPTDTYLTPEMVVPEAFLADEARLLAEGERMDDDIIRGDSPAAAVLPWLCAIMGAPLRILPGNVLGQERTLPWEALQDVRLDREGPWFHKYLAFAQALVAFSDGRFPVSHGAFVGPSDLLGLLRGHTQGIVDLVDQPERAGALLERFGDIFVEITEVLWDQVPLWHGGYFDGMYQLWAPGPIARLQEDASGVYSPALYRRFLQPIDRRIAQHFPNCFIHLHSTSMFLLDAFLEIEELGCLEINNDALGPPLEEMIPYYRRVQTAGRSLLVRGSFTPEELRLLLEGLDPRGLYVLILVQDMAEVEVLRKVVGM